MRYKTLIAAGLFVGIGLALRSAGPFRGLPEADERSGATQPAVRTTAVATAIPATAGSDPAAPLSASEPDEPFDLAAHAETLGSALETATTEQLSDLLRSAYGRHDDVDFEIARNHLVERGRRKDRAALAALLHLIETGDQALQIRIVRSLAEIATPDALSALLGLARGNAHAPALRQAIYSAIGTIGKWREEAQPAEPLATLLIDYVNSLAADDTAALLSASRGLSGLGAPAGIERLLQLLDNLPAQDERAAATRRQLELALGEVRAPAAIPLLRGYLQTNSQTLNERVRVAGQTLSRMGQPEATSALLDWAAAATTPDARTLAVRWLSAVRDPGSLRLLLDLLHRQDFRDSGLRTQLHQLGLDLQAQARPR